MIIESQQHKIKVKKMPVKVTCASILGNVEYRLSAQHVFDKFK